MSDLPKTTLDSPEILDRLANYQQLPADARAAAREEMLERFPHLSAQLNDCLDGLELLDGVSPLKHLQDQEHVLQEDLGDFQLIREIGRGGMGVVYEARQRSLGRLVALKVLPFAAFLDARQLTRFKQEAQAAAMLRHPNIVHVFCVGCERGVHFYAMDLIDGITLADVIRELQPSAALEHTSSRDTPIADPHADTPTLATLSTQQRQDHANYVRRVATIGADLADALHFAHQQGVIHRDIKPSNLMLDREGKPWVADFGLAQVQDERSLTLTGDLLGTLRYMSPEQADGDKLLDGRTDIYSLAATLYELLTLRPANPGKDRRELLRWLEDSRPQPPRQVDTRIPVDLETILLQAMEPRAENRYRTAAEFADDLRKFLAMRPIKARRTSTLYRAVRYFQRHPLSSTLALAFLLTLFTLAIVGPMLAWRYGQAKEKAELTSAAILKILNSHTDTTFLAIENSPANEVINPQLIADSLELYEQLLVIDPENPQLQATVGHAYCEFAFAISRFELDPDRKIEGYDLASRAVSLCQPLHEKQPDNIDYAMDLATSYGLMAAHLEDAAEGLEFCERAVAVLQPLVDQHPHHQELMIGLAIAMYRHAQKLVGTKQMDRTEQTYHEMLKLSRAAHAVNHDATSRVWLAWVLQQFAAFQANVQGRQPEALAKRKEAVSLYAQGYESTLIATRWQLGELSAKMALAWSLLDLGDVAAAAAQQAEVLERSRQLAHLYAEHDWVLHIAKTATLLRASVLFAQDRAQEVSRVVEDSQFLFDDIDHHPSAELASKYEFLQGRLAWLRGDRVVAGEHFRRGLSGDTPSKFQAEAFVICFDTSVHNGEKALELLAEDNRPRSHLVENCGTDAGGARRSGHRTR